MQTWLLAPERTLFTLVSLQLSFLPVYGRPPMVSPGTYCLSLDKGHSEDVFIATRQKSEEFLCHGLGDV